MCLCTFKQLVLHFPKGKPARVLKREVKNMNYKTPGSPPPQLWNAPTKEEKFNKIWESIKTEIKDMSKNETLRNTKPDQKRYEKIEF
jgi:hypothetical protein